MVGRNHPSLYSFLSELQKEQRDVEYDLREISLGKKVRSLPKSSLQNYEDRMYNIVSKYLEYVEEGTELEYVKTIGHYLRL